MRVPKSNSNHRYAITCDVIAYPMVHFVSVRLINKCQSGIDFNFTSERAIYSSFMKISVPSPVFHGKTLRWKWNFAKYTRSNVNKGMRFYGDLIYKFKRIVGKPNFSDQFKKIVKRYIRVGYNLDIMRQSACLVLNPITVYSYGFLFNCTTVGQASDSMTALT